MSRLRLAVIGAGQIGRTHIERALREPAVELVAIADPTPDAAALAASLGVAWHAEPRAMLDAVRPGGAVVATPNATHASIAVAALERGAAVLVEKPIASTLDDALAIVDASRRCGLPAIVGHQRRHNPIARQAKAIVDGGALGTPVAATAICTWFKPLDYFDVAWRRERGGGPVLINLIHDIDLMRHLFGDVASVQAQTSNAVRGHAVEDTAAVLLRFRNGALGTVTVSDTAVAPWNWDLCAGEAERFPRQDGDAHFYCGTEGSLTLPRLELWRYRGERSWIEPLVAERAVPLAACPYAEQLRHFAAVVAGRETPLSAADDAARTLAATLAVTEAAASGRIVDVPDVG